MGIAEAGMLHPEVERLDRDDILAIQREKLARLGKRLAGSLEWSAHFRAHGMTSRDLADPQGFAAAPMLAKADLHARYPFPMLTVQPHQVERFFATSGTTGPPVMVGFTGRDVNETLAQQMARLLHCIGARPGDRAYQGYGYGLWIGGPSFDIGLKTLGATIFPVGPGRGATVVQWMRDLEPVIAAVSPLWMMALVRLAREQGIDPKRDWKLRIGALGGQSVSRGFRDELEALLPDGFMAHNTYGSTEAGGPVVGASCPHSHARDEMHLINEDTVLTEILDPQTLAPVAPGEVGEVVVTTLDKEATPAVRWRTGDLVRLSDRPFDCPCGRLGMPRVGRIIGRSDDMLKVRGVIVFPSQIEDVIAATPGTVKEAWQVYVHRADGAVDGLTVAVERDRTHNGDPASLADVVARSLAGRLGLKIPVECHPEGTLPRYESKAQRVLERPEAD